MGHVYLINDNMQIQNAPVRLLFYGLKFIIGYFFMHNAFPAENDSPGILLRGTRGSHLPVLVIQWRQDKIVYRLHKVLLLCLNRILASGPKDNRGC